MYLFIINNKSMQFKLSKNNFNGFATWGVALENQVCPSPDMLDRFDQSGYDLCKLEQEFLLEAIKKDLDLSQGLEDVINSMKIVLAADKSVRTGKQISIDSIQ